MNSINSVPPSADTIPVEAIPLIQVIPLDKLVCSVTGLFFTDPVQINPCAHHCQRSAVIDKTKCPKAGCGQPFTTFVDAAFLKEVSLNFQKVVSRPSKALLAELNEKLKALEGLPERQKILAASNLFCEGGQDIVRSVEMVTSVLPGSPHLSLILPIFTLMNDHLINIRNRLGKLRHSVLAPKASQTPAQPLNTSLPKNGLTTSGPAHGSATGSPPSFVSRFPPSQMRPAGMPITTAISVPALGLSLGLSPGPFPGLPYTATNPFAPLSPIPLMPTTILPPTPANVEHQERAPTRIIIVDDVATPPPLPPSNPEPSSKEAATTPQTAPTPANVERQENAPKPSTAVDDVATPPPLPPSNPEPSSQEVTTTPQTAPTPANVKRQESILEPKNDTPAPPQEAPASPEKEKQNSPPRPKSGITIKFKTSLKKSSNQDISPSAPTGVPSTETSTTSAEAPSVPVATPSDTVEEALTSSQGRKTKKRRISELPVADETPKNGFQQTISSRLRSNKNTTNKDTFELDEEPVTDETEEQFPALQTSNAQTTEEPPILATVLTPLQAVLAKKGTPEYKLIEGYKKQNRSHMYTRMKGVNVNAYDEQGNTPAHLVIPNYTKAEGLIQALFQQGANLNAQNALGQTPSHVAAIEDKIVVIKLLRKLGASTEIKDKEGKLPIDVAISTAARTALTEGLPAKTCDTDH